MGGGDHLTNAELAALRRSWTVDSHVCLLLRKLDLTDRQGSRMTSVATVGRRPASTPPIVSSTHDGSPTADSTSTLTGMARRTMSEIGE
jgi:hypothetical protein